ncbi:Peroxisome chaperone and import receptor [Sticta canariensis]|nr:Peroxisome chaperone and import receptor [Sticta canariensis]
MDKRPNEKSGQNMSNGPINSITAQSTPGSVPDPDEDNLDDLDGTLSHLGTSQPSSSGQLRDDSHDPDSSAAAAAEFSRQLQTQMAALMGDVDESPEMRREIEAVMQELGAATDLEGPAFPQSQASAADASSNTQKPFQETIRKTMERMEASQQPAQATAPEDSDDILAQMLKEMQSGGTDGAENEEDFSKMLMGMMEQLTNKDILFEPMQELHDKFPSWMQKNESSVKADDLKRYQAQQRLVGEIVGKFNEKGYSDSNPVDREFIVERMQQMQAAGSPPADLVGDMSATQEALGDFDSSCAQQ